MRRFAEQRVLAIDPANRGFGYAVLEGPQSLLDWGVTGTRTTTTGDLAQHAETLIDTYEPDMIVVEDYGLNIARQRRRAPLGPGQSRWIDHRRGVGKFCRYPGARRASRNAPARARSALPLGT